MILADNLTCGDKSFSSVEDVFTYLFGDIEKKGDDCVYKKFIELLGNRKQNDKKRENVTEICQSIISLVQYLYFARYEQQLKIKELHKELMVHFNRYVYYSNNKERTQELVQLKIELDKHISSKYYKTDDHSAFIDSNSIKLDIEVQVVELLKWVENLFDDIYLAIKEQLSIPHKISSIFHLIKEELIKTNEICFQLNEVSIKNKLESVSKLEMISHCELTLEEIRIKRENILNAIKSSEN